MYLKVGSFSFETGEAQMRDFSTALPRNEAGFTDKVTTNIDIEFTVIRSTQNAVTSRINQIRNALRDGVDVGFYHDDGSKSAIFVDSSQSLTGTMLTKFALVPEGPGDYVTHHKGTFSYTAEYLPASISGNSSGPRQSTVLGYRESVTVKGTGGPRIAWDTVNKKKPRRFVLADYTPVAATQVGSIEVVAAGLWFPDPKPPLWPRLEIGEETTFPKDYEEQSDGRFKMTLGWNYQFISDGPLFGSPQRR